VPFSLDLELPDIRLVQVPFEYLATPVAFDANGVELYLRGQLERLRLIGGFTYQKPDVEDALIDPGFNGEYPILGAERFVARTAKSYTESKIDLDNVSPTGESGGNVFTIGFRYDFSCASATSSARHDRLVTAFRRRTSRSARCAHRGATGPAALVSPRPGCAGGSP
jgi:hypothetical protein